MKWLISFIGSIALIATMLISPTHSVAATSAPPKFDQHNFNNPLNITNRYFPLKPGTTLFYKGTTDATPTSDTMAVTDETKTILAIKTRVVRDTAYEDGVLVEKTDDWYAQDDDGNVWYMGENTAEYDENGNVISTEGSWQAGVDGAKPGIIMEAHPQVGDSYYQEYLKGEAEDQAKVISLNESICVAYGCFNHVVETRETTALEPGVVEHKYYAPNVGEIKSLLVQGGSEESHLVKIVRDDD